MATQTQHAPGTFCWVELASTDQDGAKRFYGGLFGWTFEDPLAKQAWQRLPASIIAAGKPLPQK